VLSSFYVGKLRLLVARFIMLRLISGINFLSHFIVQIPHQLPLFHSFRIVFHSRLNTFASAVHSIRNSRHLSCRMFRCHRFVSWLWQFQTLPQNIFISVCLRLWNTCWL